jgi:hypothetical protein
MGRRLLSFKTPAVAQEASTEPTQPPGADWGWKSAGTVLGIVGVALTVYQVTAQKQEAYDRSRGKQVDVALEKMSATFSPEKKLKEGSYISREKAEEALRKYLGVGTETDGYLVVTAPKGCGKSTVIHHVLAEGDRTGVLIVKVENMDLVPTIQKLVVQALGVSSGDPVGGDRLGYIKEVCARYATEHGGRLPVIVINVEGDRTNPEALGSLAKQLGHFQKALSSDTNTAFTIADISAIALASGMAYDPRAKFVNIPGLKTEQALHLLNPYAQELQEHGMLVKDIVEQIGGNPAWLINAATDANPQAFIDNELNEAEQQVESLLRAHPQYREPLRQLVLKGYDDGDGGMPEVQFDRIKEKGSWGPWWSKPSSEQSDVISVSQKYRVVHKNLQNKHVVFHTFLHYQAAKRVIKC